MKPQSLTVSNADKASDQCVRMAILLDLRAGRATEQDHVRGEYGNWIHDSEILRRAADILRREVSHFSK